MSAGLARAGLALDSANFSLADVGDALSPYRPFRLNESAGVNGPMGETSELR